jgi:long-chain acyl-CoA synthetase
MSENVEHPWYKYWPEAVPRSLTYSDKPLGAQFDDTVAQFPNHTAIIFLDTKVTYTQLRRYVDSFATALYDLGLRKGDVLGLRLPNCIQYVIAYYAAMKLGVVVTANNPLYKAAEIEHQFSDSGAKMLVVMDIVFEEARRALPKTPIQKVIGCNIADFLPAPKRILGKLLKKVPSAPMPASALRFMDLLRTPARPEVFETQWDTKEDLAVLQYTGGTTGKPKGAMLTHLNLVANVQMIKAWDYKSQPGKDVIGGVLPLFHIYAMTTVMNLALMNGCAMLLFPKPPEDWGDFLAVV